MQESCLRAYRAIGDVADSNARAWFLTIVRNTCYSWLKRHRPGAVVSSETLDADDKAVLEGGGAAADTSPTPETELIARDDGERLGRAIEALPLAFREVLVLREYHGLSYREIATIGSVPIGTVMSRLARARRHLLGWLEAEEP